MTFALLLYTVPGPSVSVTSNSTDPAPYMSTIQLTCSVSLSEAVDVGVTISIEWTGPGTSSLPPTAQNVSLLGSELLATSTLTLEDVIPERDAGDYTCTVTVSSNVLMEFIADSEPISDSTTISVEGIIITR